MPYLKPADVLQRFSSYLLKRVRSTIRADEKLVRAQVGSMASTMNFLSLELRKGHRIHGQLETLHAALDRFETRLGELEDPPANLGSTLEDTREALASIDPGHEDAEHEMLDPLDRLLETVDASLDSPRARTLREPLYDFLRFRLRTQLEMLGRAPNGSDD